MEAKELRIGNYVSYATQETLILDITRTHAELGYYMDSVGFERKYHEFRPIPLTEEWALRLGANNTFYNNYLDFEYFEIYESNGIWYVEKEGVILCELKYVHQLQNLYFALTGKELTI